MNNYPDFAYDYQLIIKNLLDRPLSWCPNQKIVYRDLFEYTYTDFYKRVKKLANSLEQLGVKKGDIVAVMDWDSHRYLENYFAVPMMGAVLHTINVRLSPEQILYTINHAEDNVIFVHVDFLPIIEKISSNFKTVKHIIVMSDDRKKADSKLNIEAGYEELLEKNSDEYEFPDLKEDAIATTFYTTGTTGNPKGVYFTHKQIVLHTITGAITLSVFSDPISFKYDDVYMPITPMFHVHAWGVPYIATMTGLKQVYPGKYEPEMLLKLLIDHKVTFSHCIPTILQMILASPATQNIDFSNWKVIIGGAALSKGLAKMAADKNIKITSGYGLSETCPILTIASLKPEMVDWDIDNKLDIYTKTGFQIPLVKTKIVDQNGNELPPGKKNTGELVVRAPWLTKGYYKSPEKSKELWRDGWLHTGDIAYKDEEGYVKITDRLKDIIKTGGEWVSSLELENLISQHEAVAEVAVVGIPDEKWDERPVAQIVLKEEYKDKVISDDFVDYLAKFVKTGIIQKWAIPDEFTFVEAIPKTSVGKIDKKVIRTQYFK
ncbi:MAG: fatty acid--CoA ligase [bacterium]